MTINAATRQPNAIFAATHHTGRTDSSIIQLRRELNLTAAVNAGKPLTRLTRAALNPSGSLNHEDGHPVLPGHKPLCPGSVPALFGERAGGEVGSQGEQRPHVLEAVNRRHIHKQTRIHDPGGGRFDSSKQSVYHCPAIKAKSSIMDFVFSQP